MTGAVGRGGDERISNLISLFVSKYKCQTAMKEMTKSSMIRINKNKFLKT